MQEGTRLWKLLRPETFTLVVVPTAVLILLASLGMLGGRRFGVNFWTSFVYLRFFGWQWFCVLCSIALGYLVFSVIAYVVQYRRPGHGGTGGIAAAWPPPGPGRSRERLRMAGSLAGLIAFVHLCVHRQLRGDECLLANPIDCGWFGPVSLLMRVDHAIFGTYAPFETHEQALFQTLSSRCCPATSGSVGWSHWFWWGCACFTPSSSDSTLAFLMVMFLALPGWFALPAVSPSEAYRLNRLQQASRSTSPWRLRRQSSICTPKWSSSWPDRGLRIGSFPGRFRHYVLPEACTSPGA